MTVNIKKLLNRKANICGRDVYGEFSVLVPLIRNADGDSLLFEVRSEKLSKQPNEICFPGGRIEKLEEKMRAAVRETSEELLIASESIGVIGELDTVVTPFNTVIYPFTGIINDYLGTYNPDEVKEVFHVPVSYLMETKPLCHYIDIEMKPRAGFPYELIQEGRSYPWAKGRYPVYFYIYEDKIIWGITARIVYNFVELLKESDN